MISVKISSSSDNRTFQLQELLFLSMNSGGLDVIITDSYADADIVFVTDLSHWNLYADILARPEHVRHYDKLICYFEHEYPPDMIPGIYACGSIDKAASRGAPFYFWLKTHPFQVGNDESLGRPYLFSFMGRNCNRVRNEILKLQVNDSCINHLLEDTTASYPLFNAVKSVTDEDKRMQRERYFRVLSQSKFALAPKGTGLSSIRQYEAMACGCVPVVLSDKLKQPFGIDWEQCSVQIKETDVSSIPVVLKKLEPEFYAMSGVATEAYQKLIDPVSFWKYIEDTIVDIYKNDMDKRASINTLRKAIALRAVRRTIYRRKNDVKRLIARFR